MKRMPTANKLNIRFLLPLTEIVIAETINLRENFLHITGHYILKGEAGKGCEQPVHSRNINPNGL